MSQPDKSFEDVFREKIGSDKMEPSQDFWNSIESRIPQEENTPVVIPIWRKYSKIAVAASLFIVVGLIGYLKIQNDNEEQPQVATKNDVLPLSNTEVAENEQIDVKLQVEEPIGDIGVDEILPNNKVKEVARISKKLAQVAFSTHGSTGNYDLPDNSSITLSKHSELTYQEDFGDKSRKVSFSGEGYFEIAKDENKPFEVICDNMKITVLGTKFFIKATGDSKWVYLTEGKVELSFLNSNKKMQMTPGMVIKSEGGILKEVENPDFNMFSWKTNSLKFKSKPMAEVLSVIEAHYDVEIDVPNELVYNCRFTGKFLDKKIEEVLSTIALSMQLKFSTTDEGYKLEGKGCEI